MELKSNQRLFSLKGMIFCLLLASPCSYAHAQTSSSLQNNFVVSTDITITGNYLVLKDDKQDYDLDTQWPVDQKYQWQRVLYSFERLPVEPTLYNPIIEKDPEVIIFVQNNPDQISGEDVYMSGHGTILRVQRKAVDRVFYDEKHTFFDFLNDQLLYNKSVTQKTDSSDIMINTPGLVIIYRGSTALENPSWVVSDPKEIEKYTLFLSTFIDVRAPQNRFTYVESDETNFDGLDTFMIYTNYKGASSKLLCINEHGYMRSTRIELFARSYVDKMHFFKTFLAQALDEKAMYNESDEKRKQRELMHDF
ncbi:MAG: hypothetical protein PHX61_10305 [Alphaproteobacteria bacterium]|nr:hypothetical protein [Alphaproteobacteria bacterium]